MFHRVRHNPLPNTLLMKFCLSLATATLFLNVFAPLAHAENGDAVATIAVTASRLVSDPGRDRVYASLTDDDSVAVISTKTLETTKTLAVGSGPVGMAISRDGNMLYVALSGAKQIAVIDLTTLTVLPSLPVTQKCSAIVAGLNNRLYLAPAGFQVSEPILQIDAITGGTVAQVGPYKVPGDGLLQITPDGNSLYFGDTGTSGSTLRRYDLTTSPPSLVQTADDTGSNGLDLKLSHNGQFLCYPNGAGNTLSYETDVLNPADLNDIYGKFNTEAYPGPLAFIPSDLLAYEVHESYGEIFAFSTTSFGRVATLHYPQVDLATELDLAVDRSGRYLFFAETEGIRVYDLFAQPAPVLVAGELGQSLSFEPAIYIGGEGSLVGSLPAGLTFDATSRKISGVSTKIGAYPVVISVSDGTQTITANVSINIYPHSRPLNISTRLQVSTGDSVLIAGFIISGETNKDVVVRGLGPSLESDGQPVSGRLEDPTIEIHDATGAEIASNDDYSTDVFAYVLPVIGLQPPSTKEAALYRNLAPGAYTVIVKGGVGVGLAEVYDVDEAINGPSDTYSRLINISTRGAVGTGDNVMIAGAIVDGPDHGRLLVRGLGPSLATQGVSTPVLENPTLTLYNSQGTKIGSNDDWQDSQAADIEATGLAPTDPLESAIDISVAPGAYTAVLSGVDAGTGVGLVELYNLP